MPSLWGERGRGGVRKTDGVYAKKKKEGKESRLLALNAGMY